jgi:hypothetical protein
MTYKFKDRNDELIQGSSLMEVVEELRNGSMMCADQDLQTYMIGFAKREKMYSGFEVRYDTIENFVADLTSAGYWRQVE